MSKSYRIRTTPGEDNGYLKVNVDLNQNYDHLEILSLKIWNVSLGIPSLLLPQPPPGNTCI